MLVVSVAASGNAFPAAQAAHADGDSSADSVARRDRRWTRRRSSSPRAWRGWRSARSRSACRQSGMLADRDAVLLGAAAGAFGAAMLSLAGRTAHAGVGRHYVVSPPLTFLPMGAVIPTLSVVEPMSGFLTRRGDPAQPADRHALKRRQGGLGAAQLGVSAIVRPSDFLAPVRPQEQHGRMGHRRPLLAADRLSSPGTTAPARGPDDDSSCARHDDGLDHRHARRPAGVPGRAPRFDGRRPPRYCPRLVVLPCFTTRTCRRDRDGLMCSGNWSATVSAPPGVSFGSIAISS